MKVVRVNPDWIQPGDHIITQSNVDMTVKYTEGPDRCGAFDFHGTDAKGNDQIVIVTDPVKLIM